jgi:hypothetical protein
MSDLSEELRKAQARRQEIADAYIGFMKLYEGIDERPNDNYFRQTYNEISSPYIKELLNENLRFGEFLNRSRRFNSSKLFETKRKAKFNLPKVINLLEHALGKQLDLIDELKAKTANVLNPEEANQQREENLWKGPRQNLLNYSGLTRKNRKSKSRKSKKSRRLH